MGGCKTFPPRTDEVEFTWVHFRTAHLMMQNVPSKLLLVVHSSLSQFPNSTPQKINHKILLAKFLGFVYKSKLGDMLLIFQHITLFMQTKLK
jgi:hypothetical protein